MKRANTASATRLQPLPTIDRAIPRSQIQLPAEAGAATDAIAPAWMLLRATGVKTKTVAVSDLADASITFQFWRERNNLRSSQMHRDSGSVFASDRQTVVAKITYNGRVWNPEGGLIMDAAKWETSPAAAALDRGAVKEKLAACAMVLHAYWEAQRMLEREMGFTIHDIDGFIGDNFTVASVHGGGDVDDDVMNLWMGYAAEHREWEQ